MLKKKQIILSWIENYREITKKKVRFHFFNNIAPQYWNLLSDDLINSVSINFFRAGLDGYLHNLRFW